MRIGNGLQEPSRIRGGLNLYSTIQKDVTETWEICAVKDNIDNLIQAIILLLWLILFWINDWYPVFLWDWLNIYSDISLFIIVNLCIVFISYFLH